MRTANVAQHVQDLLTVHHLAAGPDDELLRRYLADRDEAAFAALVHRHGALVFGICRRVLSDRHLAEDAFQATFLVLARKAAGIRKRPSLNSWLHGVAFRVARKVRTAAQRRDPSRLPVPPALQEEPGADVRLREVRFVIDEELQHLAEKHRAPLVLCYLEGKTRDEAAQQLGCPLDTLKDRLERGRRLLGERLKRRGLVLSAALVPLVASADAPAAALLGATTRAAQAFAMGQASMGNVSTQAIAAAQGVISTMAPGKLKMMAAAAVAAMLLLGVGGVALRGMGNDGQESVAAGEPSVKPGKVDGLVEAPAEPMRPAAQSLAREWGVPLLPERDQDWVEELIRKGQEGLAREGRAALPGFVPIVADRRVIVRTYSGIHVVNLKEPAFVRNDGDPATPVKNEARESWNYGDGGAESMLADPAKKAILDKWKSQYLQKGPHDILIENSIFGTAASDGQRAYVVDDLILPPASAPEEWLGKVLETNLQEQGRGNTLKVYQLDSMKLAWELGARLSTGNRALDPLRGSSFLCPPLVDAGRIYLLNESNNEIRVLCLEPRDKPDQRQPTPPDLVWQLTVAKALEAFPSSPARRIRAVQPILHGKLLICPTNAGTVLAVDVQKGELAWRTIYRHTPPVAGFGKGMRATPSVVAGNRVVFSAPDDAAFHCVDLRTGELLWKIERTGELYLAGAFGDLALLVGARSCRAVRIANGEPVWQLGVGVISGVGVAVDQTHYLLPLQVGAKSRWSELCLIDVAKGAVVGHVPMKPDEVPGNLMLVGDLLVSQTSTGLTAYKQFKLAAYANAGPAATRSDEDLWDALGSDSASRRGIALWALELGGDATIKYLKRQVPVVKEDRLEIERAVAALGDNDFTVRKKAAELLEAAGALAEPEIRKALRGKPDLDMTDRLGRLLKRIDKEARLLTPESRRTAGAVDVVERIRTPEARALMKDWADGASAAPLTKQAILAQLRMGK